MSLLYNINIVIITISVLKTCNFISYFNVSSSFSLATTDSSNLISKAVVVWSLIEKALTLQAWPDGMNDIIITQPPTIH